MFWGPGSVVRDHQQLEKIIWLFKLCSLWGVRCCTFGLELVAEHHTTLRIFLRFQVYGWHVKGLWLARFKTLFLQQHFTNSSQISGIQPATLKSNFSATQPDSRICCPSTFQGTAWGWLEIAGPRSPRVDGFFLEPKPSLIIQYPTLRHTRISFALSMEISIISHNYPDLDHFCCSTLFKHPVMMFFFDPASLTQARWQAEGRGSARK